MNEPVETGLTDEQALQRLQNTITWLAGTGGMEHRTWAGGLLQIHNYFRDRLQGVPQDKDGQQVINFNDCKIESINITCYERGELCL